MNVRTSTTASKYRTSDPHYQCGNLEGLTLDEDLHTCVNINECDEGIDGCHHGCRTVSK